VPLAALGSYAASPAAQDARYTYPATLICQLATVAYTVTWLRSGSWRRALSWRSSRAAQNRRQHDANDESASARI